LHLKNTPKLLSKTKILKGYQCLKNIYLTIHNPELESPITPDKQAIFDQGNRVGQKTREHFPGGTLVDFPPWDFVGSLSKTKELISQDTTILYEAAFEYNGTYARVDILQFSKETQRWKMFEVKSSTKLKDEHLDDIGLQAWIIAKSGLPLEQINLMNINSECTYPDLTNLFTTVDLTQQIRDVYPSILPKVNEILTTIRKETTPEIAIGPHCTAPYECGFMEHCWKDIPTPSIFDLPKINSKKWEFFHQGIIDLKDERISGLSAFQDRALQVHRTGKRFVDSKAIQEALSSWKFPLVFLDFETINPAIPRYEGTHPYQQVPFQYSVHVLKELDWEVEHQEFLHTDISDPRPALIPKLIEDCGAEGVVVAYYAVFEKERMKEMAESFPQHKEKLEAICSRLVDPLPIIREFVYDVGFNGSFGLKNVAPALLGKEHGYDGMLVADGGEAQRAFEEIIDPKTNEQRKKELTLGILEYCKKDTLVMVELVRWLFKQVNTST
jgi:hypothetical protein